MPLNESIKAKIEQMMASESTNDKKLLQLLGLSLDCLSDALVKLGDMIIELDDRVKKLESK